MLSYKTVLLALLVSTSALALPVRREVPQEHSHEQFLRSVATSLQKNNPDNISDPVFGLLGAAAAAGGAGKITDTDCLQQATADQAFTNAKAAGDVKGMSDALIYRALERNTLGVGVASKPCTSIKAKNPEIAAIQQHQDAASDNATEVNKAIEIELAKQLKAVGGNPKDALLSATFKPGDKGDSTAKGFTCDDANDAVGCIISGNLLVPAATEADIDAAVGGAGDAGNNNAATPPPPAPPAADNCPAPVTVTVTAAGGAATAAPAAPPAQDNTGAAPPPANNNFNIGNFGKCSVPEIEFAAGFDGRKETAFQPSDLSSFNHGSAQNIAIITQFICDTLTNSCGADQTAKDTCTKAKAAADAAPPKQGIDADTFNGFFGIATNFRNTQAIDDQGRAVAGSTGGSVSVNAGRRRRHL